MAASSSGEVLLVITPTPVEWKAMREKITRPKNITADYPLTKGTIGNATVICAMPGKGSPLAGAVTMDLIHRESPRYVFVVGVAGGLGATALGDVVVPTAIQDLDYGKIEGDEFHRRRENDWVPDHKLLQYATLLGETSAAPWGGKVEATRPDGETLAKTKVHFGYIGSSSKVVDNPDYAVIADARKTATELLAVEMEATGVAAAVRVAQGSAHMGILMIRGISDLPANSSTRGHGAGSAQRENWKPYASAVAAAFTAALIKRLYPRVRGKTSLSGGNERSAGRAATVGDPSESQTDLVLEALANQIKRGSGLTASLVLGTITSRRSFRPPPPVAKVVRRDATIQAFAQDVGSRVWTAVVGPRGSGKTHLASLLASASGCAFWFRGEDIVDVASFEQCLRQLAKGHVTDDLPATACARAGKDALIVFDDFSPRASSLIGEMTAFARAAAASGVRVISLSATTLPSALRHALDGDEVRVQSVPDFSDDEARHLFCQFGAPQSLTDKHVAFLNALARGNPTILTAIAEFLASRGWRFTVEDVQDIFSRAHLADLEDEIFKKLFDDITEPTTRELFYRIQLARRRMSIQDIERIAAVTPPVSSLRERLATLEGLWLRRTSVDVFEVAPLSDALPEHTLDGATERAVHIVLGELAIDKPVISRDDVVRAVMHFVNGHEVNRAGAILAFALSSITSTKAWHEEILPAIWSTTQIPPGMDLSLQLFIRLLQLKFFGATGKDPTFILADVERLIPGTGEDDGALLASIAFESVLKHRPEPRMWNLAILALERVVPLLPPDGGLRVRQAQMPANVWITALYLTGRAIETPEQALRWMTLVDALPADRRALFDRSEEFDRSTLVNEWWLRIADGSAPEAWEEVIARLETLALWALAYGDELLAAYAHRARIISAGEYLHDLARAVQIGRELLVSIIEPHARFLLCEALGTQYLIANEPAYAEEWFLAASEVAESATPSEDVILLLRLAQVVGRRNASEAIPWLERALATAMNAPDEVFSFHREQIQSELGLAHWLGGSVALAFECWDGVGESMFALGAPDETAKRFVALLHAAIAHAALKLRFGWEPIELGTGRVADRPKVGLFNADFRARDGLNGDDFRSQVALELSMIAGAIGRTDRAELWSQRAYAEAEIQGDVSRQGMAAMELLSYRLLKDDVLSAVGLVRTPLRASTDRNGIPLSGADSELEVNPWFMLVLFRIARIALDDPTRASALLREVGEVTLRDVQDVGRRAILEQIFDAAGIDGLAGAMLKFYTREDVSESVRLAARLLHSLDRTVALVDRAADHVAMAYYVHEYSPLWGYGYISIVLDFFEAYWTRELLRNGFRFTGPADVRRVIGQLPGVPVERRLQTLLERIADSVGVQLSDDYRRWFQRDYCETNRIAHQP